MHLKALLECDRSAFVIGGFELADAGMFFYNFLIVRDCLLLGGTVPFEHNLDVQWRAV